MWEGVSNVDREGRIGYSVGGCIRRRRGGEDRI